jgi:mono/diheme cytochrome c family protein
MKRIELNRLLLPACLWLAASGPAGAAEAERQAFLDSYCMGCHNLDDYSGGLAFDLLPLDGVEGHEETWEKVLTKAGVGMMPPPSERQPEPAQLAGFLKSIEVELAEAARRQPNPGSPGLHRLNAREYQNAIRDLLDLRINARELLPADDSVEGFDNIAEGLVVSPALIQAYVSAAGKISRLAVGDPSLASTITNYRSADPLQGIRQEALPLGTRGGVAAEHIFPLDGEYEISVSRSRPGTGMRTPAGMKDEIEVLLDGERVHLFAPGEAGKVTIPVRAGRHDIAAAFVRSQQGYGVNGTYAGYFANTRVTALTITGPTAVTGPGDTESRRRIFSCQPRERAEESACAQQILENLATRAYRRPVDEDALAVLMQFYDEGRSRGFETGIQHALARILVDPKFIYRFEEEPLDLPAGSIFRIDDYDLASRLSFFLWSSIPDDELLLLADARQLSDPAVLQAQVQRMLADPKAAALVENFAPQWLSLQLLDNAAPLAREFDEGLRQAMRKETELLIAAVFGENRSVLELLSADYTFVNERLARHYGIPNIRGDHFRRVSLADSGRSGLLGHASILTATSAPNRTSPVLRGTWILETLLGAPPPEPPPGVEANIDVSVPEDATVALTVRARLEAHRENPSCAGCHDLIDPLGFALENFDLIGRWRDEEDGVLVDSSATLWDGSALRGANELRQALLQRQELFAEALTRKLMTYALGRVLSHADLPTARAIVDAAANDSYRFAQLISGIVASDAFGMRVKDSDSQQLARH